MQYSVKFKNVSENDQLVLRLIFSLSAKARGRNHAYALSETDSATKTDICIHYTTENNSLLEAPAQHTVWLVPDANAHSTAEHIIRKPLIASRVLNVLDRYVSEKLNAIEIEEADEPSVEFDVNVATQSKSEHETEMEFSISEEEASQLAIVDDEALSNPANAIVQPSNSDETIVSIVHDVDNARSASLLVLHKNKELEVSQLAFDNRHTGQVQTTPRALVVDDSPSVRKQIELELDLFNVEVDFAESVADANLQLQRNTYDVVFLDVVLPDGDGFGICRTIRSGASHPTVIMLTGKATPADKIKGTMAGCDAYLVKPVGRMTFQNTVCNYLQLREQLEVIHTTSNKRMETNHGYK